MKRFNLLLVCLMLMFSAQGQNKKKATAVAAKTGKEVKKADSAKQVNPYEKLFKNKESKTLKGMITLHKIDGKIYFEFPKALLDKSMLMGSVVESVSNSDDAFAGQQAHAPLNLYFTQIDSSIYIRRVLYGNSLDTTDEGLKRALEKNNMDPVMASFKILATSPDSLSVVFEPTSFFVNGHPSMDPFKPVGGLSGRSTSYKADKSLLGGLAAFPDNVSITSLLSFGVSSTFFGFVTETDRPSTIAVKRTLMLLPEKPMRPRFNDPRIGVAYTRQNSFSGKDDGISPVYYANHWNLKPKNSDAMLNGQATEPVEPIVFYIDDHFPADWIPYIKEGIERWNDAFRQAGYQNVLVTRMYPKDDPAFDPDNIKYNCVKFAPTTGQDAFGPAWVDPRSGEILSASIYIDYGLADKLSQDLFLHTAAADHRVRTTRLPTEVIGDALRYMVMQKAGLCLGLLNNYGGSASIPVDSLRSASFTQKYGITASVMDDALYNFVAQPGDFEKGVVMTQKHPGVYDQYAIRWLYSPVKGARTPQAEVTTLDKWISDKISDPMYRYIKRSTNGVTDPNALTDDLGDDKIKSTQYAYSNLKYILNNMDSWVEHEDKDYRFRRVNNFAVINIKFYWYFMNVLSNIGGMYQYERYEGDPLKAYSAVSRETQRNSVLYLMNVLENLSWMNNPRLEQNMDAINGNASDYMRRILFPYMMRWVANIGYSEAKDPARSYTQAECVKDIFDYVWSASAAGKAVSEEKRSMQTALVKLLISNSKVAQAPGAAAKASSSVTDEELAFQMMMATAGRGHLIAGAEKVAGFGTSPKILYQTDDVSHIWYGWLLENQSILEKLVKKHRGRTRAEYEHLLLQINQALGER